MWPTAEARWFFTGEIPETVLSWFVSDFPTLEEQSTRTDRYLLIGDTDGLGVKHREGRIEVKQRFGQPRPMVFAPRAAGVVELWRKWGFGLAEYAPDGEILERQDAWVSVQKSRLTRNYRVESADTLVAAPRSLSPVRECTVELTQVLVGDQAWWTIGFEAMGLERLLVETLTIAARHLLVGSDILDLGLENSYGYPRWLQVAMS
jgi:hypothetical protein